MISPPPLCFSFQTVKGTPTWPRRSTFPAVPPPSTKTGVFSKTRQKGQVKVGILKVPFSSLFFFFISIFFSLRSNLKCTDEVNYFFIVYWSLFFIYLIFMLITYPFPKVASVRLPSLGCELSDGNHSAVHLLHLGQHSLQAAQDLVLVRRRGDADASHVPKVGGEGGREEREERGQTQTGSIHVTTSTAFHWTPARHFNC